MKRLALLSMAVIATVAAFLLLYVFRSVVLLFVAALVLAATIRPLANRMMRLGIPRSLATLLLVLLVFVGLFAFLGVSGYVIAEDLPRSATDLQLRYAEVRAGLAEGAGWQQSLAARLPAPESLEDLLARIQLSTAVSPEESQPATAGTPAPAGDGAEQPAAATAAGAASGSNADTTAGTAARPAAGTTLNQSEQRATTLLRLLVGTTSGLAGIVAQSVMLIFLSLYWSLENEWFERLWISLLPPGRRAGARSAWHAVEAGVGAHVRSELLQSVLSFLVLWAAFSAMGVSYPLLLAWLCALLWLIPLVGWLAALFPVALVGLLSGPAVATGAVLTMTVVFALMEFVVEPRLDVRRRAGSILGLLVAMLLLDSLGFVGLLVASPVAVAISILFTHVFALQPESASADRSRNEQLESRLAELRATMSRIDGEIPPRTLSLYERLQELLIRAERSI